MASNQESPGIKLKSKRLRLGTNFEKCIKCQTSKAHEKLQTGMQSSVVKFIQCAKLRNDDVFKRLEPDLTDNGQSLAESVSVKWHKSCYSSYTSNENVRYQVSEIPPQEVTIPPSTPTLRSTTASINWKLCLVCQQVKCKGEKDLTLVVTKQVFTTLMQAAEHRRDEQMLTRIRNEDLIAVEAKYHRGCYQRYTVIVSSSKSSTGDEKSKYDEAFFNFIVEIGHKLSDEGRAYDMSTLLSMYKKHLTEAGIDKDTADTYKAQNLKKRMIHKYGEKIAFHSQFVKNKAELVCSASLNLGEIINLLAELKDVQETSSRSTSSSETDTYNQVLYHAAVILRNEIKNVSGIETKPLNVCDLTLEKASKLVPSRLQLFLRWVMQSQKAHDADLSPIEGESQDQSDLKDTERRKILAIGQDIITCNSCGRKKMPKNVGLGNGQKTV